MIDSRIHNTYKYLLRSLSMELLYEVFFICDKKVNSYAAQYPVLRPGQSA